MFKYLFGSKPDITSKSESTITKLELPQNIIETNFEKVEESKFISRKKEVYYVVLNKNTNMPLGIYDTLEKAKIMGQKATYHNCIILEFKLNEPCKFVMYPIFENK